MTTQAKLSSIKKVDYPIGRITLEGKNDKVKDSEKNLILLFADFIKNVPKGTHVGVLITPAAFLKFDLPPTVLQGITVDSVAPKKLKTIEDIASKTFLDFLNKVGKPTLKKLASIADFLSIGIDGSGTTGRSSRIIELIAIYDLKRNAIIHWTGKFYPDAKQANNLIRYPKVASHFLRLNGNTIMILGCHDLNVFHPRGKEKITGWRSDAYNEFLAYAKKIRPQIVIQHPHWTLDQRTWINGWKGMERMLPTVEHYASGIRTINSAYLLYSEVEDILRHTKKGKVFEYTHKL